MFLPVLLIRDFGAWSFVVFAVPNVIGAGAMGWVLRRPGAAARLREDHRGMVEWFSLITVLFHVCTLLWVVHGSERDERGSSWVIAAFVAPFVVLLPMLVSRRVSIQHTISVATWVASLGLLVGLGVCGQLEVASSVGERPLIELLPLTLVCVLGFALCPYLDATFLWATDRLGPREAPRGFGLGFGALFLTMIVGTFLYAGLFGDFSNSRVFAGVGSVAIGLWLGHYILQFGFTSRAHAIAWNAPRDSQEYGAYLGMLFGFTIIGMRVLLSASDGITYASLSLGEVTYRCFMAFYGLVFPAYVWLCMIPNWTRGPATRWQWRVWLGVCVVAAPMYWMGFIERETWWLVPGVGLVLAARVLVGRSSANGGNLPVTSEHRWVTTKSS